METPVARLTEDDQVLRTFLGESLIGAVVDLEAAHAVAELATALGLIDRQEPLRGPLRGLQVFVMRHRLQLIEPGRGTFRFDGEGFRFSVACLPPE
jgi:hypothetical protein